MHLSSVQEAFGAVGLVLQLLMVSDGEYIVHSRIESGGTQVQCDRCDYVVSTWHHTSTRHLSGKKRVIVMESVMVLGEFCFSKNCRKIGVNTSGPEGIK